MEPIAYIWRGDNAFIDLETNGAVFQTRTLKLPSNEKIDPANGTLLFRTSSGFFGFQQYQPTGLELISPGAKRITSQLIGRHSNNFQYDSSTDRIYSLPGDLQGHSHPIVVYARSRNKWIPIKNDPAPWLFQFQNIFWGGFTNAFISPNGAYVGGMAYRGSESGISYPFVESLKNGKMFLTQQGKDYYLMYISLSGELKGYDDSLSECYGSPNHYMFFSNDSKFLYVIGNQDGTSTAYRIDTKQKKLIRFPTFHIKAIGEKNDEFAKNLNGPDDGTISQFWYGKNGFGALESSGSDPNSNLFILRETNRHTLIAYPVDQTKAKLSLAKAKMKQPDVQMSGYWPSIYDHKKRELVECHLEDSQHILVIVNKINSGQLEEVFRKVVFLPKPIINTRGLTLISADGIQLARPGF